MMIRAINITVSVMVTLVVAGAAVVFAAVGAMLLMHILSIAGLTMLHIFNS